MSHHATTHVQLSATYKQICKLFFPIALAFFIPQINFFTNSFFISQLGEDYLASYTIIGVYYLIFAVLGISINNGLQMLMAKKMGSKNLLAFTYYFNNGNSLGLLFSCFGVLFTFFFLEPILNVSLSDSSIVDIVMPFIKIRILGLPFLYLYLSRNALFVNINKAHFLIYTSILETLVNVFFDYTLIFGNLGFANLGVQGAAWSSLISEVVGYLSSVLIIKFLVQKTLYMPYRFLWNRIIIKDILYTSTPLIFQYLFAVISWQIFFILIENMGKRELAISGVMRTLIGVLSITCWAFGQCTNTMMSNFIGQNKQTQIIVSLRKIMMLAFACSVFICSGALLFIDIILHQFSTNAIFVKACTIPFYIILIAILIMSIGNTFLNTIIALGNTKINLYIESIAVVVYLVYTYMVIKFWQLSLAWAWGGEILYWLIIAILAFLYFIKWKNNAQRQP